jgi:hypothetical protein
MQHPNELEQHNNSTVLAALTLGYPTERGLHWLHLAYNGIGKIPFIWLKMNPGHLSCTQFIG